MKCPMPFTSIDIESNGDIKPCCIFEGVLGNVNDQDIDSVWNGNQLAQLRNDMLSGKHITGCRQCYVEEKSTGYSKRIRETNEAAPGWEHSPALRKLDIKLGNTCNLKCRICNYESSSLFNSENRALIDQGMYDPKRVITKQTSSRYKWHSVEDIWDQFDEYHDEIQQIDFMGGEPFLDKQHNKILERLIEKGRNNNIVLNYTTNGTIRPDFEILNKFKKVLFTLSADASHRRFEYCRFPAKWDEFVEVADYINANADQIVISYSVSSFSLFGLPDALDYYGSKSIPVWFNYVHLEPYSNCQNLPPQLKAQFAELIAERRNPTWDATGTNIDEVLQFLSEPDDPEQFVDLLKQAQLRDQIRKQNVYEYLPELLPYAHLA